jgi:hypothetical protein
MEKKLILLCFLLCQITSFYVIAQQRIGCVCNDNTVSKAVGAGACSGHGGVKQWLYDTPVKDKHKEDFKTASNLPTVVPPMAGGNDPNFDPDDYEEVRIDDKNRNKNKKNNGQNNTQRIGCECEDGTFSQATSSGACSGHGGVVRWLYGGENLDENGRNAGQNNNATNRYTINDDDDGTFSYNDFERAGSLFVYILALVLVFLKVGWVLRKVMNKYLNDENE